MRDKLTKEQRDSAVRMFFWDKKKTPMKFVDSQKLPMSRLALAGALGAGDVLDAYKGWTDCLFPKCGKRLGTCDMFFQSTDVFAKIYIYPEKCEHYVLHHGVWVPEAEDFIQSVLNSVNVGIVCDIIHQADLENVPSKRR